MNMQKCFIALAGLAILAGPALADEAPSGSDMNNAGSTTMQKDQTQPGSMQSGSDMNNAGMNNAGTMKKDDMHSGKEMKHSGTMHHDYVTMKDGKMMVMKDGKMMAMDQDMTMKNGTMVMKDGTVMMKDGGKMMMKNGQKMDMNGHMMQHHHMEAKKAAETQSTTK